MSFYSFSKDADNVQKSGLYSDMITTTKLKPGRKISGFVMFQTRKGEANSSTLKLIYGMQEVAMQDVGIMPYDEWKEFFSGKK